MMSDDASALMVLTVLALGTFTAGIHVAAWRLCFVGIVLGLGVPAIAWFEERTLFFFLLIVVLLAAVVGFVGWNTGTARKRRHFRTRSLHMKSRPQQLLISS